MDQIKIGRFLKGLRSEKRLTQEQMAEQLNVSGRTVSRWETGKNMPDIGMLVELAGFFDVSISELIDGERKGGKMDREEKEIMSKVADYSENERGMLMKRVFIISIIGLAALSFALLSRVSGAEDISPLRMCMEGICYGAVAGALLTCIFFATGVLSKVRADSRSQRIVRILRVVCPIIVAICILVCMIKTI